MGTTSESLCPQTLNSGLNQLVNNTIMGINHGKGFDRQLSIKSKETLEMMSATALQQEQIRLNKLVTLHNDHSIQQSYYAGQCAKEATRIGLILHKKLSE